MPARDRRSPTSNLPKSLSALPPEEAAKFLLSNLSTDTESGVLLLSNVPCVIVRPETITSIQKQLEETIGGSAKGVLYLAGERSARDGMSPFASQIPKGPPLSLANARRIMDSAALLGWGRVDIATFDPARGRLVLTVKNSPLARAYGTSKKPVCHFLSGWIGGLGRFLLDREVLCEETACAAHGHDRCEFELQAMTPPRLL
jgi:predicted hydrocarbon binding protein